MNLDLSVWEWMWVGAIVLGIRLVLPLVSNRGGKKEEPPAGGGHEEE